MGSASRFHGRLLLLVSGAQHRGMSTQGTSGQREVGKEVVRAAMRGAVAAMSMSGMRALTTRLGLLGQTPPETVVSDRAPVFVRTLSKEKTEAAIVLLHWTYGAAGGAAFGALPARLRLQPWAGPVFGTLLWLGFETAIVPLLGLRMRRDRPVAERVALAADHLLYGIVLSELRRRPQA